MFGEADSDYPRAKAKGGSNSVLGDNRYVALLPDAPGRE